ncbi:MAG: hypothetical protein EZS28_021894 [Streblomastix strix]|uniref:Uncharacterized protein n=1 Tax=Streblomastix strix TaxID=222440 RepID=A0A5J4VJ17_9EUKA|nr:MAG: hypothetical protein EZS28_021894 [Streblomastix strix]
MSRQSKNLLKNISTKEVFNLFQGGSGLHRKRIIRDETSSNSSSDQENNINKQGYNQAEEGRPAIVFCRNNLQSIYETSRMELLDMWELSEGLLTVVDGRNATAFIFSTAGFAEQFVHAYQGWRIGTHILKLYIIENREEYKIQNNENDAQSKTHASRRSKMYKLRGKAGDSNDSMDMDDEDYNQLESEFLELIQENKELNTIREINLLNILSNIGDTTQEGTNVNLKQNMNEQNDSEQQGLDNYSLNKKMEQDVDQEKQIQLIDVQNIQEKQLLDEMKDKIGIKSELMDKQPETIQIDENQNEIGNNLNSDEESSNIDSIDDFDEQQLDVEAENAASELVSEMVRMLIAAGLPSECQGDSQIQTQVLNQAETYS